MRVFDASAVLAVLNAESGAERAAALINEGDGVISSVNFAEVVGKLVDHGLQEHHIADAWQGLRLSIRPFDAALGVATGLLRDGTRKAGLSLGDRCCLALASALQAEVVTADRAWKSLAGFRITLVR